MCVGRFGFLVSTKEIATTSWCVRGGTDASAAPSSTWPPRLTAKKRDAPVRMTHQFERSTLIANLLTPSIFARSTTWMTLP